MLIPCSNKITYDQMQLDRSKSPSPDYQSTNKMININGMKFVDPHSTTLHHSGYCFVEFESYNEAIKALKLNTQLIPNIKYYPDESEVEHINTFMDKDPIDIFTSFHTNPDSNRTFRLSWAASTSLNAPSIQTPEYSMFIGDISKSTTETELMIFFQKSFKSINSVRIMTDPLSGQSRCFGFIRFGNIKDRDDCIVEYHNKEVCGTIVRCALAAARNNSNKTSSITLAMKTQVRTQITTSAQEVIKAEPAMIAGDPINSITERAIPCPRWKIEHFTISQVIPFLLVI